MNRNSKSKMNVVQNPKGLQLIFYLAIIGFPCLSIYLFHSAFAQWQADLNQALMLLFLAFCFSYFSYIGVLLAKFVPVKLEYDDDQFSVISGKNITVYQWSDIAAIKNHPVTEILRLLNKDGKTIYVVDHRTPGYHDFEDKVQAALGIGEENE